MAVSAGAAPWDVTPRIVKTPAAAAQAEPAPKPLIKKALKREIDWSQPPASCVEDVVPAKPNETCIDLSRVADPRKEWPDDLPEDELAYWKANKRLMPYCRGSEVLRREAAQPGSMSPVSQQIAWMQVSGATNRDEKIAAIYAAARAHRMPPQIITGALYQESLFAELGVAEDGGNYSCGVGQINIQEWCRWANAQPAAKQAAIGWPAGVSCSTVPASLVQPFYDLAKLKLNGLPDYKMTKEHFMSIKDADAVKRFSPAPPEIQQLRLRAVRSFLGNCSNPMNGIAAKANELASLYRQVVPAGLKQSDQYRQGETFARKCRQAYNSTSYPMASGWLLAVGAYNAGPRVVDALAHFNGWTREDLQDPETFRGFTPANLIEAFYGAGRYDKKADVLRFRTLNGSDASWGWFKPCVLQRHIARVVQHVTLAGAEGLVTSLEGEAKCAKSDVDPKTGRILTNVPMERQMSSGRGF